MLRFALLCGVVALGCTSGDELSSSRAKIIAGRPAEDARGVVAVVNTDSGTICSGVMIAPRVVLTARHCVAKVEHGPTIDCTRTTFGDVTDAGRMLIATTTDGAIPDQRHGVVKVLVPEEGKFCGGDLAALILPKPIDEDEAAPIAIRTRSPEPGETFTAIGFGRDGDAPSGARRRRDGLKVSCVGASCKSSLLAPSEWWGDGAVCEGDSGGPALDSDGHVVGIASRKRDGCTATIYANVATASAFIAAALGEADKTPESADKAACSYGHAGSNGAWLVVAVVLALYARGSSRPTTAPPPSRLRA
jgi:hypothetical protein